MRFFNSEDIARIRERVNNDPAYLTMLDEQTRDVRKKRYIQKTGLATWSHYYVCPRCAVKLDYDYYDSEHYTCPLCGTVQTEEPFRGAWWDLTLNRTCFAASSLAIFYIATGNKEHFDVSKEILLGYADNYHNYEVHGGIPYNNPGRMASQTLSDSGPLYNLAIAYGIICDELSAEEKEHIENDLFRPAAKHLVDNLTPQIHNHEVIICSAIGAIGLALDDEALILRALDGEYGLKYQIDNAYLEDNFWFECSTNYHIYSMTGFMRYEHLAKNTKYSLFADEHYREKLHAALKFPLNICDADGSSIPLNDGGAEKIFGSYNVYEYAYAYFGSDELLWILNHSYPDERRSVYSLVWGADELPRSKEFTPKNYFSERGSGLAVIREGKHVFCMKATPFGGEHDHYDRLGISDSPYGKLVSADFGTAAGYSSPLHYGYFKNTATHNTVTIDGENMAPCDTRVNKYEFISQDNIYLDAETMPPEDYKMLDSFTIKQWSDEAYRGVTMRRIISWHEDYFIDVFAVKSDNTLSKDWTWHVYGKNIAPKMGRYLNRFSTKKPQSLMSNAYIAKGQGMMKIEYLCDGFKMDVHTLAEGKELIYAEGPNNPADTNVSYLLERSQDKCPIYVNVIESYKDNSKISKVEASVNDGRVIVKVTEVSGRVRELDITI